MEPCLPIVGILLVLSVAFPPCLAGQTCPISQGATTIQAFCEAGCCGDSCCTESDTAGISTLTIVMCALLGLIVIIIVVIAIVYSCCKKRPRSCYRNQKEADDEAIVDNQRQPTETMVTLAVDGEKEDKKEKKNGTLSDESSSGYSSTQSARSNSTKRLIARPASPPKTNASPVVSRSAAPAANHLPQTTAFVHASAGFPNPAFEMAGDRTDILLMNKSKSQSGKTVTFKRTYSSPRGSFDSDTNNEPPARPLRKKSPSRSKDDNLIGSTDEKDSFSPKKSEPSSPRRRSRPASEKDNALIGSTAAKDSFTPRRSKSTLQSTRGQDELDNAAAALSSPRRRDTRAGSLADIFPDAFPDSKSSEKFSSLKTHVMTTDASTLLKKESGYTPTVVKAADSNNSVDSIDVDEAYKTKPLQRNRSFPSITSPYTTEPYLVKKKRALSTTADANIPVQGNKQGQTSSRKQSIKESAFESDKFVSSYMRKKYGSKVDS